MSRRKKCAAAGCSRGVVIYIYIYHGATPAPAWRDEVDARASRPRPTASYTHRRGAARRHSSARLALCAGARRPQACPGVVRSCSPPRRPRRCWPPTGAARRERATRRRRQKRSARAAQPVLPAQLPMASYADEPDEHGLHRERTGTHRAAPALACRPPPRPRTRRRPWAPDRGRRSLHREAARGGPRGGPT